MSTNFTMVDGFKENGLKSDLFAKTKRIIVDRDQGRVLQEAYISFLKNR